MTSRDRKLLTEYGSKGYLMDAFVDGNMYQLKIIDPTTGRDLLHWRFENECAGDGESKQVHELFKQLFILLARNFDNNGECLRKAGLRSNCDNGFLSVPKLASG